MASEVTDLPEPDSPTTASVSAAFDVEAYAVDRLDHAAVCAEVHVQVIDLEEPRGSGRSRGLLGKHGDGSALALDGIGHPGCKGHGATPSGFVCRMLHRRS